MRTKIIITLAGLFLAGCAAETVNIDVVNDEGKAVMELDTGILPRPPAK